MITRKETKNSPTSKANGATRRFSTYLLMFVCIAMLATGFFLAARQHFSSMDFGMKNSRLRKQVDQLEAEKRRLMLAKEISLSPTEIKKAAKKAGMLEPLPIDGYLSEAPRIVQAKSTSSPRADDKALVVKTVSVSQSPVVTAAAFKKADRPVKDLKKTAAAE